MQNGYCAPRFVNAVSLVRPRIDAICFGRLRDIKNFNFAFPSCLPLKHFFDRHGFNVHRLHVVQVTNRLRYAPLTWE